MFQRFEYKVRAMRSRRTDLVLNVTLLDDPRLGLDKGERTVVVNLSKTGCFLFTSRDLALGQTLWMVINEFEDHTPIELKLCWRRGWGTPMSMPGIGACFVAMTPMQYVQLHAFLK